MTSFRSRCQVVSTELFSPVVVVPSAKSQFPSLERKTIVTKSFVRNVLYWISDTNLKRFNLEYEAKTWKTMVFDPLKKLQLAKQMTWLKTKVIYKLDA